MAFNKHETASFGSTLKMIKEKSAPIPKRHFFVANLFEAVRGVDVVGGGVVSTARLSMKISSRTEGLSSLLPLLGHLKHVRGPMIALDGIVDLVGAAA